MATVLITGENEKDCAHICGAIQPYLDCTILSAYRSDQCTSLLQSMPFDALVLDVNTPPSGGFELCRRIRCDDGLRDLPIILLIQGEDPKARVSAVGAGSDDYLSHPVDVMDLVTRLKLILRLRRLAKTGQREDAGLGRITPELAHKLRSPLNSVLGMAELVQKPFYGELSEKQREFIHIISNSGRRLLELINDHSSDPVHG